MKRRRQRPGAPQERDVIRAKANYSGEKSPYQEWLVEQKNFGREHGLMEPVRANPDHLSEDQAAWPNNDSRRELLDRFDKIWTSLTAKQKRILTLVGIQGKTFEEAAAILGVHVSTVQVVISRIQKKAAEDDDED